MLHPWLHAGAVADLLAQRRDALLPALQERMALRSGKPKPADIAIHNGGLLMVIGEGKAARSAGLLSARQSLRPDWREIAETRMSQMLGAQAPCSSGSGK